MGKRRDAVWLNAMELSSHSCDSTEGRELSDPERGEEDGEALGHSSVSIAGVGCVELVCVPGPEEVRVVLDEIWREQERERRRQLSLVHLRAKL